MTPETTRDTRFWRRACWRAPFIALLLLVIVVAPLSAHQPWFNDAGSPDPATPYRLPSALEISQVVYGALTTPEAVEYYTFNAPADFELSLYVTVPDSPACAEFRPAFALLGPGLAQPANVTPATLPPGIPAPPAGSDVVVAAEGEWQALRDGELALLLGPPFEQRLPGGEYLVAVFDPQGGSGSYGLTTNGEEIVTLPEGFWAKAADWSACKPVRPAATATP